MVVLCPGCGRVYLVVCLCLILSCSTPVYGVVLFSGVLISSGGSTMVVVVSG